MPPDAPRPWSAAADGVRLAVRLTPRSSREGPDGVTLEPDGRPVLRLRIAAPPVDGAANAALVALLARALGLRKADVALLSGASGRLKLLALRGEPADIARRLEAWVQGAGR